MNTKQKKTLYESIMKNVSKTIKKQLNESDNYNTTMYKRINDFFDNGIHTGSADRDTKLRNYIKYVIIQLCKTKLNIDKELSEFDSIEDVVIEEEDADLEEINDIKRLLTIKRAKQKEVMNLFMAEKIDYNQFKYMSEELDNIIQANETRLSRLEQDYTKKPDINKAKISRYIVDHWRLLTDKEKLNFLNEFVESITIVNRDTDRHKGKAEVLDIRFYDTSVQFVDFLMVLC